MADQSFVHLHVHTHYSLLDGACKVPELVKRCKSLGMNSLAISDHGCMFGAIEFYNECRKHDIKPIIGMEAYMAPGDRRERSTPGGNAGEAAFHLLLLARNLEGYKNLMKLASTAYRDGFYYKPRIDKDVLREHSKGLIATSACLGGEIPSAFLKRDAKTARRIAETYLQIFEPDHFFIEVQKQGIAEQDMVNPELVELAKKLGCGTVATNDVHFLTADDHFAHDVLCCISMGRQVSDEARLKYPQHLYLKSPQEMTEALKDFPEAIENTVRIAEMCDLELDFSKQHTPVYKVPVGATPASPSSAKSGDAGVAPTREDERYLRQLCEEGLVWRYGTTDVSPEIRDRLEKELSVIAGKDFCSYFLIVWDFCNYARENGIPVGARGSAVGTMAGYLLGLCNIDPIRYGLLFERFMDPSRSEMPDIDIDICQDGRQKVIEYVRQKYGHVAQIITFGTLAAKAACKDVGRVLGVPLAEVDRITKLIPNAVGMTLDIALAKVPELQELYNTNPTIHKVIDIAKRLEGMCRNAGVHAAGVIIADQPLDEIIPLCTDKDDNLLTQFEGGISEKCGLLKMDFLGLRTLTTLQRSIDLEYETRPQREQNTPLSLRERAGVRANGETRTSQTRPHPDPLPEGEGNSLNPEPRTLNPLTPDGKIDIEHIDFTDRKVLDLFCRGETKGIFQFESGGMQDLLMKMQPDRLEDLIAANALYRPGPMELIPLYCNRKHGRERVPQEHPIIDQILAETYAIMVYQEQVMQIFNQLGGIELASAYKIIKAISKKQSDIIGKFKPEFIRGCADRGVEQWRAEEIFELILKFGGYGFNKSHSTRYTIIALQTAYMKTYHPVEYMAALLTFEMGNTDKVVEYIEECRRLTLPDGNRGIKVLPPDVNVSAKDFTPVYLDDGTKQGEIRFGLMAVRGVGEKAVEAIVQERETRGRFASLFEFCERIDMRVVTRATIEALIKCGAFSSICPNRAPMLAVIDRAVEMGQQTQLDKRMGQLNMFGGGAGASTLPRNDALPNVPEFTKSELLKLEKELLGFYITSHPLTEHQATIDRYSTASTKEALTRAEGSEVMFGAMITRVKKSITKNGRSAGMTMAMITLEDLDGQMDGVIFAEDFARISKESDGLVAPGQIVFVRGKIDRRRETPSIIVSDVLPLSQALAKLTTSIGVKMAAEAEKLDRFREILKSHAGRKELYVQVQTQAGQKVSLRINGELGVRISQQLVDELEDLLGENSVQLGGEGLNRIKRLQQQQLFKEASIASEPEPTEQPIDPEADSL